MEQQLRETNARNEEQLLQTLEDGILRIRQLFPRASLDPDPKTAELYGAELSDALHNIPRALMGSERNNDVLQKLVGESVKHAHKLLAKPHHALSNSSVQPYPIGFAMSFLIAGAALGALVTAGLLCTLK